MSRVTRHKHVLKEMMEDDYEVPQEHQQIVRVVSSRGNNLHEVEAADGNTGNFLVTMPTKFRKNVWVKRGDFLLVEPIEEGDKVKAEICKILTAEHIKEYTKAGVWPKRFTKKREHVEMEEDVDEEGGHGDGGGDNDGDGFVVRNRNRSTHQQPECSEDSSDEHSCEGERGEL